MKTLLYIFLIILTTFASLHLSAIPIHADAYSDCIAKGNTPSECKNANSLPTPSTWLSTLTSGNLGLPSGGLSFITGSVVPFAISLLLFLTIVLSLIFLLVGGILIMTSGGNKEGTAKARATVTYAIIGLVLGLSSFIILSLIQQFLGVSLGMPFPSNPVTPPQITPYVSPGLNGNPVPN